MAANKKEDGGVDSPIDFPLYLNFDQCTNWGFMTSCERAGDETSIILHGYLTEVAQQYGEEYDYGYHLNEDVLNSLGIDIYIEGERVNKAHVDEYSGVSLENDGEYNYCILRSDGWLIYEG